MVQVPEADTLDETINGLTAAGQRFEPNGKVLSPVSLETVGLREPSDFASLFSDNCYQQPTAYLKKNTSNGARICEMSSEVISEKRNLDMALIEGWLQDNALLDSPGEREPHVMQLDVSILSAKDGSPLQTKPGYMTTTLDTPKGFSWPIVGGTRVVYSDSVKFTTVQLSDAKYYITIEKPGYQTERFDKHFFSPSVYHEKSHMIEDGEKSLLNRHYIFGLGSVYLTPIGMTETVDKAIIIHKKSIDNTVTDSYKIIKNGIQIRKGQVEEFNQQFLVQGLIPGQYLLILDENDKHPRQVFSFAVVLEKPDVLHVSRANKNETSASLSWKVPDLNLALVVVEKGDGFGSNAPSNLKDPDAVIVNYAAEAEKVSTHLGGLFTGHTPELLSESVVLKSPYDLAGGGIYEFMVGGRNGQSIYKNDAVNHITVNLTTKDGRSRNIYAAYNDSFTGYRYWVPFAMEDGEAVVCSSGCWDRYPNYHAVSYPEGL